VKDKVILIKLLISRSNKLVNKTHWSRSSINKKWRLLKSLDAVAEAVNQINTKVPPEAGTLQLIRITLYRMTMTIVTPIMILNMNCQNIMKKYRKTSWEKFC
jgi:hypothetical protein